MVISRAPLSIGNDHPLIGGSFAFLEGFTILTFPRGQTDPGLGQSRFFRSECPMSRWTSPFLNGFWVVQALEQFLSHAIPPEGLGLEEDLQRHHWLVLLQEVLLACDA